jgi:hypothetical protein
MTERELLAEVAKVCEAATPPVRWVHLAGVRRERCRWVPGLPDLLLVGAAGCCWRELKCGSTRVTAVQASWFDALEASGQDVAVWGPLDLADGTIAGEITALNSRPG